MPNPYPARFASLLDAMPPGSVSIDLGSGGRSHLGLISMEYVDWPNNTLRGDCLALPFRDDSVDLILSQAVLEHVINPDLAMREMHRILRPGGILYVEIAFMQPVHCAPHHYFNVTPHGLSWLLRDWDVVEQGTLGTMYDTVEWILRSYGIKEYDQAWLKRRCTKTFEQAAYGVYAEARKPV